MFRCLSMNVSNELSGFGKHFYAIFLANQMLAGLAHYDSKAFIYIISNHLWLVMVTSANKNQTTVSHSHLNGLMLD